MGEEGSTMAYEEEREEIGWGLTVSYIFTSAAD
jgi:hypothetical protein